HQTPVLTSWLKPTELPAGLSLSLGTTQGIARYELPLPEYRRKLLAAIPPSCSGLAAAAPAGAAPKRTKLAARSAVAALLVLVALAAAGVKQALDRHADYRWAQDEALPRIRALVEDEWRDYTEAYAL